MKKDHDKDQDAAPIVGRPRGAAWRALNADGIVWEGQVLLAGEEVDLAARLIVTRQRLAFARGGGVALEVPRSWLRPAPTLLPNGAIRLAITPDGGDEAEPLVLRVADGRPAAAHLVSLLAGAGARPIVAYPIEPAYPDDQDFDVEPAFPAEPVAPWTPPEVAWPTPPDLERWEPPALGFPAPVPSPVPAASMRPPGEAMAPPTTGFVPDPRPAPLTATLIRPSPPPMTGRHHDWNLRPLKEMSSRSSRNARRGWRLRLGGLLLLLAFAAFATFGRVPTRTGDDGTDRTAGRLPAVQTATATTPGADLDPAQRTAVALGVGGPSAPPTETEAAGDDGQESSTGSVGDPTAGTATEAVETAAAATVAPSAPPTATAEPTPIPTPVPTPTAPPTATSTAAPSPSPRPTPSPTMEPTTEPTEEPPPRATQAPSVAEGEVPDQAVVGGAFRYTVEAAVRGPALPELGLPVTADGDWVAVLVHARNVSDAAAGLSLSNVFLLAGPEGFTRPVDSGTGEIAALIGFDPVYDSGDVLGLESGETARVLLLFTAPVGSEPLTLLLGDAQLGLEEALAASPASVIPDADEPIEPEPVEATVVEVVDGQTIAVELELDLDPDGARATVRYLGVAAPTGNACWAEEATEANAALVEGETVLLERQRSDVDDDDRLLRDVWVEDGNGGRVLAAARLAELGAVRLDPQEPDTRFAGWLRAASATAEISGAGLWGACGTGALRPPVMAVAAVAPITRARGTSGT